MVKVTVLDTAKILKEKKKAMMMNYTIKRVTIINDFENFCSLQSKRKSYIFQLIDVWFLFVFRMSLNYFVKY